MTTKLEQAARALLAHWDTPAWKYLKPTGDLMADLREALAEPDIEEMTLTQIAARHEQAEQEPVGVFANVNALTPEKGARWEQMIDSAYDGVEYIHLYAAPQPMKQEPVAIDGLARACNLAGIDYKDFLRIKAYLPIAAPVQQVDLTDYEIVRLYAESPMCDSEMIAFARAVIAADREKNK